MQTTKVIAFTLGIYFFCIISLARAENFVEVFVDDENEMFADVDVDSILTKGDSLVYFTESSDIGESYKAVNCQKRISYLIGKSSWENPDWINQGREISPGSNGAKVTDFVCARVR